MRAEAIIVNVGEELVASVGSVGPEHASELAGLVSNSARATDRSAKLLGESGGCFGQSLREGAQYGLYSLRLGGGGVLSPGLGSDIPLGGLRCRTRQVADELLIFLGRPTKARNPAAGEGTGPSCGAAGRGQWRSGGTLPLRSRARIRRTAGAGCRLWYPPMPE